jgi:O-antigen/teichoic acid export membrane protein
MVSNLANYTFQVVVGRGLGPDAYGLLAGFMGILGILTASGQAFQTTVARMIINNEGHTTHGGMPDAFTRESLRKVTVASFFLVCVSPIVSRMLDTGLVVVMSLAVFVFPAVLDSIAIGRLQGLRRFGLISTFTALQSLTKLGVAIVILMLGLGVTSMLYAIIIGASLITLLEFLPSWNGPKVGHQETNSYVVHNLITTITYWTFLSLDVPLARLFLSKTDSGFYAANSLLGKTAVWMPLLLIQVIYPELVEKGEGKTVDRIRAFTLLLGVTTCTITFLAFFGDWIRIFMFGEQYRNTNNNSWLIAVAVVPFVVANLLMHERVAHVKFEFVRLLPAVTAIVIGFAFAIPRTTTGIITWLAIAGTLFALLLEFGRKLKFGVSKTVN